jgi:hypothetical protein
MTFFKLLIEYWAQSTVLILAIGYVIRVILEFYIKRKEIKFNFIHKERAEVIKQLHLDIIEMSREIELMALAHTLNQGPTNKEREEVFHKIVKLNGKIYDTIERNRIYFSESFISQFDTLVKKVGDNFITTSLDKNVLIKDETKEYIFNDSALFLKYHKEEFPILKDRLQKEFKKYL